MQHHRNLLTNHIASLIVLMSLCSVTQAKTVNWGNHLQLTATEYIVPLYQTLTVHSKVLYTALDNTCSRLISANDTQDHIKDEPLLELQDTMRTLYLSWAKVQHINFGPMSFLKRKERFQYWPDKHHVGSKQLRRFLNNNMPLPTLEELQQKSVAIQGLPALETLLFSKKNRLTKRQCQLAIVISKNLYNIASNNEQLWTKPPAYFANEFIIEKYKVGVFSSQQEIANILFNSLTTQLSIIEHIKIPDLTRTKKINHRKLEAWKSELSLELIEKNIKSLKQHYLLAFHPIIYIAHPPQAHMLKEQFANVIFAINRIKLPLSKAIKENTEKKKVIVLKQAIATLNKQLKQILKQNLQLTSSFNSLDGD